MERARTTFTIPLCCLTCILQQWLSSPVQCRVLDCNFINSLFFFFRILSLSVINWLFHQHPSHTEGIPLWRMSNLEDEQAIKQFGNHHVCIQSNKHTCTPPLPYFFNFQMHSEMSSFLSCI